MDAFDIAVCIASAGLGCWFVSSIIRKHRRKQQGFQQAFYERWPSEPRPRSFRRSLIKSSGSSSSRSTTSDSDTWSLTGAALSGSVDSDPPVTGHGHFHGEGGQFGGAGASGNWDAPSTTETSSTTSDTGGTSDGGSGGSSD